MLVFRPSVIAAALALGLGSPSLSADLPVDLELVLAVDVSPSMEPDEQLLQRQGYIAAFRSEKVLDAIEQGAIGRIAVTYVEWGGAESQNIVLPWTLIEGRKSAEEVAAALSQAPPERFFGTSIAGALAFSTNLFKENGFAGERLAIDISGDGPNNVGPPVLPVRDAVVRHGVTINGLPIMIRMDTGLYSITGLDFYYEDCVIGGPGAFIVVIKSRDQFRDAIERKLILEISRRANEIVPVVEVKRPDHMNCLAGEKNSGRLLPLK
jgi:hypothetical protein